MAEDRTDRTDRKDRKDRIDCTVDIQDIDYMLNTGSEKCLAILGEDQEKLPRLFFLPVYQTKD